MIPVELQTIYKINQIEDKFFRDTLWLMYSPEITLNISNDLQFTFDEERREDSLFNWFESIQNKVIPAINSYLPLGKYAEYLLRFYFENNKNYELIANNLQLKSGGITKGELDYLLKDIRKREYVHLEFSVKFYLKVEVEGQLRFLGPSTKDWLGRKLKKLTEHQSQYTIQHNELLPKEFQSINFLPKISIKGMLFYPFDEWKEMKKDENFFSSWWLSIENIEELACSSNLFCIISSKSEWIFPFDDSFMKMNFKRLNQLTVVLLESRNELMLVRYNSAGKLMDRGFLMRKNWPNPK